MDVEEILSFAPNNDEFDETGDKSSKPKSKRAKLTDNDSVSTEFDEIALKRLLLQFERKVLKNQEMRIKFGDNPNKFMDSEIELFDCIQEMHVLSTQQQYYAMITKLNIIPTLLGLLSHENTDISCSVVALLQELTDLDDIEELNEVTLLLDALIDGQIIALLITNMERLDETIKEEAEGVYNSLAIIENITDYKPDLSIDAQPLISWILKRFKAKLPFDGNKLYASEILSILLQNNKQNRKLLKELDGIDTLLQQIAYYKRHDPSIADEHEYMENIFNSLCSSLLLCDSNRKSFFKGEGIELMNLILKEKRKKGSNSMVRMGAIKIINHCLSTDKSVDHFLELCCNKFIEILGLRVLMPIFMKPTSIIGNKKKDKNSIDEVEEHCLSIILALLKNSKIEYKRRVIAKFVELDFEKTDRLIELHMKYSERLIKCDSLIKKERAQKLINEETINEEEFFMRRLTDGGLFILQIIDHIIIIVCSLYDDFIESSASDKNEQNNSSTLTPNKETIKARVMKLINLHATSVNHYKFIKNVMTNLANERVELEKQQLIELIDEF